MEYETPLRNDLAGFQSAHYFFTVHLLVLSSHLPLALSQSAFVLGSSAAKAGAAVASRRPVMIAMFRNRVDMMSTSLSFLGIQSAQEAGA